MDGHQTIRESIITDMSEGVMAIRYNGIIELANDAALAVLEKEREELTGCSFASCFFDDERNDAFAQTVLDAIYEKRRRMESYVSYFCGEKEKQLRVVSSYLRENGKLIGIILVLSDITELNRMRDAVKAMERIRSLNEQLELRNRLLKETFGRYLSDDIVREILDTPDGAVLWHCSQGKDRTGIGAALILGALGADRQTIIDDFALSYEPYRPLVETLCEEAARIGAGEDEFDVIRAFMGVSVRNFTATMDLIDSKYRGMHSYLTETLLLSEEDLATLRTRYLELP